MSVSRRLAGLEGELGARLFHRTTRSLSLTAEGETFLPYAQTMLEIHDEALLQVGPSKSELKGTLKLTAPSRLGRTVVVPVVTRLLAENPLLQLDLDLSDSQVDLIGEGLDLAVRVAQLPSSELIATRLADNPRVLCASPGYLSARGVPRSLEELLAHSLITLHATDVWPFETDGELRRLRVSGRFSTNSVEAMIQLSLRGAGIALTTYWDVKACLDRGDLVRIDLQDVTLEELAIWAVFPTRKLTPPRVQAAISALREALRPGS